MRTQGQWTRIIGGAAILVALALGGCDFEAPSSDAPTSTKDFETPEELEEVVAESTAQAQAQLEVQPAEDPTSAEAALKADVPALEPLEVVREFTCDPAAVPDLAEISDVTGIRGATMAIRPDGPMCSYHLYFRHQQNEQKLSKDPGGYLLTVAGVAPSGRALACASNIHHIAASEDEPHLRRIESVGIECSARGEDGAWSPLLEVLGGEADYAAWVLEVQQSNRAADRFRVLWIRDFSFQFLNLTNAGRPEIDGVYATDFELRRLNGELNLHVLRTERMSDVVPADLVGVDPWAPTRADIEAAPGVPLPQDDGAMP